MADNYIIGKTNRKSIMISKMSREAHSTSCESLLEVLSFATLEFIALVTWSGAGILAAISAFTRIYADIKRRFEKKPFRFLALPSELRNIIYEQHFALYRTSEYHDNFRNKPMLPDAILGVSRQIYEEASHVLYYKFEFKFKVTGVANVKCKTFDELIPIHVARHTNTAVLELYWPYADVHYWFDKREMQEQSFKNLTANFEMACTGLAGMPNLRTLKIAFIVWSPSRLKSLSLMKYLIQSLLRPLEQIRRANPELVVEVNSDRCPPLTVSCLFRPAVPDFIVFFWASDLLRLMRQRDVLIQTPFRLSW